MFNMVLYVCIPALKQYYWSNEFLALQILMHSPQKSANVTFIFYIFFQTLIRGVCTDISDLPTKRKYYYVQDCN